MAMQTEGKTPEKSKNKPNFFVRTWKNFTSWLRSMRSELKKVSWPSGKQVVNNTLVVLAVVVACGIVLWVFDWLASQGVGLLNQIGR